MHFIFIFFSFDVDAFFVCFSIFTRHFISFFFARVVSYEVLMLTSKCEVCGLPDRGQPGHGQFPCGHFASHRRRTSTLSASSGFYIPTSESPAPSPTSNFLGVVGPAVSGYSPVKDSSKSLLSSLCRYRECPGCFVSISGTFSDKYHFVFFECVCMFCVCLLQKLINY